jgi:hypothetical protein
MSKLKNVDAVKQLLDGNHKTQTKTTLGYVGNTKQIKREVGEKWEEVDPKNGNTYVWEQKDGYRIRHGNLDSVRELIRSMEMPDTCPSCNKHIISSNLNKKMWNIHKMCSDCVIDMEAKLRYAGKFEEYAKHIMYNNAVAWFKDADKEVQIIKDELEKQFVEYVNADGSTEKWEQTDKEKWLQKIDQDYYDLKQTIINNLSQVNEKQN